MTTINNTFKSKVFKAAWTSIRNGKSANLSQALTSAWAWAKRTLVSNGIDISAKISKSTEKAVAISINFVCVHTDQVVSRLMWIPKSLVNNAGEVAEWFFNKKIEEMKSEFSNYGGYNSLTIEF
jgi:hypothetical protein